jgi:hypothetical protein
LFTYPSQGRSRCVVTRSTRSYHGALGQIRERLPQRRSHGAQLGRDFGVSNSSPHTIGTHEQHVVWFQWAALGQCHVRQNGVSSEATFDEVAHRVNLRLIGSDQPFTQQKLDVTVISGP